LSNANPQLKGLPPDRPDDPQQKKCTTESRAAQNTMFTWFTYQQRQ